MAALAVGWAELDSVRWIAIAATALAAIALVLAVVRLLRAPTALELSRAGYRVPTLRGVGVRAAAWKDVHDVSSQVRGGQQVVVIRLHDSSTTSLPVRLVDAPTREWVAELDARLDAAHGQRRLR